MSKVLWTVTRVDDETKEREDLDVKRATARLEPRFHADGEVLSRIGQGRNFDLCTPYAVYEFRLARNSESG